MQAGRGFKSGLFTLLRAVGDCGMVNERAQTHEDRKAQKLVKCIEKKLAAKTNSTDESATESPRQESLTTQKPGST
jgi:hypothetical protein